MRTDGQITKHKHKPWSCGDGDETGKTNTTYDTTPVFPHFLAREFDAGTRSECLILFETNTGREQCHNAASPKEKRSRGQFHHQNIA